ncbi:MAG TPA: Spy/CpxP family protein refolding chaperone, partial [Rhodanobacteraceae bacterium]|nr:Spy/CpxP family protein refolding chaperone [Rhodanobacteraceae bacterium]
FAAAGVAAPPPPPAPPHQAAAPQAQQHVRPRSILDQLELTDSQRTRIQQLQQSSMEKERSFMQTLRQKQEAFSNETPGGSGYQSAANALATAEANAARAHVLTEAAFRADVYHLLTPEQRTKLATLTAQQKARVEQWRKEQAAHAAAAKAAPASSSK